MANLHGMQPVPKIQSAHLFLENQLVRCGKGNKLYIRWGIWNLAKLNTITIRIV